MVADATYLSKIKQFDELYDDRVSAALSMLANDAKAVSEIERSGTIIKSAVQELAGLYEDLYIKKLAQSKADALRFARLEANIAMVTQQSLDAMQKMIDLSSKRSLSVVRSLRSRMILRSMSKINASLARRDDVARISPVVAVKQLLCAGRKPLKTSLTVIVMVALHRPVTVLQRLMDPSNFFRSQDVTFAGIDAAREQMAGHPRRVLVIIANHDTSLYDGTMAQRMAHMLGSEHHIVITRKGVFPIPPPESAGDVVFIDEENPRSYPVTESVVRTKEALTRHDVVSLAVFPEGMMAFAGAQMPLVTKEGAFVVARKLAIELKDLGIPVFLLEAKSNTLVHITQLDYIEAAMKVTRVETVPATPLVKGKPDEWIERRRLEAENRFNEDRGEKMLDIQSSTRIPGAITYAARGLRGERCSPVE